MTAKQVNKLVLSKGQGYLSGYNLEGFEAAVFDEVCAKIAASEEIKNLSDEAITLATITAFKTAYELMTETITALLNVADTVSLNYRKHDFQFNKNTGL